MATSISSVDGWQASDPAIPPVDPVFVSDAGGREDLKPEPGEPRSCPTLSQGRAGCAGYRRDARAHQQPARALWQRNAIPIARRSNASVMGAVQLTGRVATQLRGSMKLPGGTPDLQLPVN